MCSLREKGFSVREKGAKPRSRKRAYLASKPMFTRHEKTRSFLPKGHQKSIEQVIGKTRITDEDR